MMSQPTLADRVGLLEQQVGELRAELSKLAQPKDWRGTLGMFAGDEVMKRIDAAGRKIREGERRRAMRAPRKARAGVKR